MHPEPHLMTRAEALALGITRGRLCGPGYRRLFHNLYVVSTLPVTDLVRAMAALKLAPAGAVLARHTAALLLGGVLPASVDVHLTLPHGRMRTAGIDARPGVLSSRARYRGLPITSAEDTFIGLGADLGLVDLVVLGDSLVKARRCTPTSLVSAAGRASGHHARVVRRAASLVRTGVDSPMESRLRMLMVLAGLPEPKVNHTEYDEAGWVKRRFDLSYPEQRLAVEYDGRQHAESDKQWERDVERREGLDTDEWRLVVVLAKGIYREPARTLRRIEAAMADRGVAGRLTSEEWRLHFPGYR